MNVNSLLEDPEVAKAVLSHIATTLESTVAASKPEIERTVNAVADALALFQPALDRFRKHMTQNTVDRFNEYVAAGFSREESMVLLLNTRLALAEAIKSWNRSNSKPTKNGN